jgi:hypothetical protein
MRKMVTAALVAAGVAAALAVPAATASATASPMVTRVGCFGPFPSKWPVKIHRDGQPDQCFQFWNGGGETLLVNDYYQWVSSGSYRIVIDYPPNKQKSLNPGDQVDVPGGFLQEIHVVG